MMRVVRMPKTVRVGPHVYSVLRQRASQMGDLLGECDTNLLQIRVRQRLPRSKAQETLTHELLHACTHPSLNGNEHLSDEQFVEGVAPVLLQVIRDNPDLLDYLRS